MAPRPEIDDDNPLWTAEDFARARPGSEVLPPEVVAAFGPRRGRPPKADRKAQVTMRLDPDVLDHFKAGGPGWQSRINAKLREVLPRS